MEATKLNATLVKSYIDLPVGFVRTMPAITKWFEGNKGGNKRYNVMLDAIKKT